MPRMIHVTEEIMDRIRLSKKDENYKWSCPIREALIEAGHKPVVSASGLVIDDILYLVPNYMIDFIRRWDRSNTGEPFSFDIDELYEYRSENI